MTSVTTPETVEATPIKLPRSPFLATSASISFTVNEQAERPRLNKTSEARTSIPAMKPENKMTERYIKCLLKKKINVYLDAEKAVELGIADIIV